MTKQIYWKCVDCSSMINDENIHEIESPGDEIVKKRGTAFFEPWIKYAEFCYGCMSYHPEVVLAYA